ncbi:hypothetical protein H2659_17770 [Vibrio cholerae]|uniref:hypothetical protein n=1 Tax=Vibrio cholerae TaxID=666 RepID=UPI00193D0997|nr:hypothetical protein [Vibrio parahaemolyticus]
MNYVEIASWLKDTIPGIILLGMIGSLAAGIAAWLLSKLYKGLIRLNNYLIVKVFGESVTKLGIFYLRYYYTVRSTVGQLRNKDKELPLIVIHQQFLASRNLSVITFLIFSLVAYLMFLFVGTSYPKTTALFVAIAFLSMNDSIVFSLWARKVEDYFYGVEKGIAEETYKTRDAVILESLVSFENLEKSQGRSGKS